MTTIILSNGSHCLGSGPDTIEELLEVLESQPLDRTFEDFGGFHSPFPSLCDQWGNHNHDSELEGKESFFGNFFGLSHVFNIYTDESEVIQSLSEAISRNKARPDYLSQAEPRSYSHPYNPDCHCISCNYERAAEGCSVCQSRKKENNNDA